jgi:hypothetical protein
VDLNFIGVAEDVGALSEHFRARGTAHTSGFIWIGRHFKDLATVEAFADKIAREIVDVIACRFAKA